MESHGCAHVFSGDVAVDSSTRVYRNILTSQIRTNASNLNTQCFTFQQKNCAKHAAEAAMEFSEPKSAMLLTGHVNLPRSKHFS